MSWAKKASDDVRSQWIPHRNFRQAESEALAALLTADPGEVLCILGPSRVGKSSLVERMKRSLIGDSPSDGSMPMVSIVLENNSTGGLLSSKAFTVLALLAVHHPMFGTETPEDLWGIERMRKVERTPESVLRTAFENALRYRGSKYLIIDEAHHLLYARGGLEAAAALLDSLKCLAARTQVVLILVGAYPMIKLLTMLPHLIGRKLQVDFARYHADNEPDVFEFNRILNQYSQLLRFTGSQSLRDWNEYLYSGSFGCLGLLRGWIREALNRAWLSNAPVLTRQHFEASRKTDQDLQSLFLEIQSGEQALRQISSSPSLAHDSKGISKDQPKANKGRPFTAKPRRFAVGERRDTNGK